MQPRRGLATLLVCIMFVCLVVLLVPEMVNATTYQVTVHSTKAVYVDEGVPNSNFDTFDSSNLNVGRGYEFGNKYRTFIEWSPISQDSGGVLPSGATIVGAKVRLYKTTSVEGSVTIYRPAGAWSESTLTWNNQPSPVSFLGNPVPVASVTLPATTGWVEFDIPYSLVQYWVDNPSQNYGLMLAANWTTFTVMRFRSDDTSSRPGLVISYEGASAPLPPPLTPVDTVPCELTYTVTPSNPRVGETVTVTVHATDNQALSYAAILRGTLVLARQDATSSSQTALTVTYSESATLPSLNYTLIADDLGDSAPRRVDINVPVTGSGGAPVVTASASWDILEVIPERFRLIEGDGQRVTVTATASDPDGIETLSIWINGREHRFNYTAGNTSVSESVAWTNTDRSRTNFTFYASAQDREGRYVTATGETHTIARYSDIRLLWNNAFTFRNWGDTPDYPVPEYSWTRMVQTFGGDSCWTYEPWNWENPYAWIWYHAAFRDIGKIGHCWGISTAVLEMYRGRISPGNLEPSTAIENLDRTHTFTLEYIEARHGGQFGDKAVISRIDQYVTWAATVGYGDLLLDIKRDLRADTPGLISVRESDKGHIVVPWMTRRMSDGTTRVYVYDSNYTGGIRNSSADFNYFPHYPYLEMPLGLYFSYATRWNPTENVPLEIWNDKLLYFSYSDVLGNTSVLNRLGTAAAAPSVTDQNLTGLIDAIIGIFSGDGDVYFEDSSGRITGMHRGTLKQEIPRSLVIVPDGGDGQSLMYILPTGTTLTANVAGKRAGEYTLGLIGKSSACSIEEKAITAGGSDRYVIDPGPASGDHRLRIIPGVKDSSFRIRLVKTLPGRVQALNRDSVDHEYIMERVSAGPGDEFRVYTGALGNSLVVAGLKGQVNFDVVLRSTKSLDIASRTLTYIPGSTGSDLTVPAGETISITPVEWATAEQHGEVEVVSGEVPDGDAVVIRLQIDSTKYYVGGVMKNMDTAPIIREGRTLLPIRFVAEPLGASIGWDVGQQKATVTLGEKKIELWIGHNRARINGVSQYIDSANHNVVPITVPPGRTMLPLRFIAEALGCRVDWNAATRKVTITYQAP